MQELDKDNVHDDRKDFVCRICKKVYARQHNLDAHFEFEHEEAKKHKCHICHKYFVNAGTRNKHIKAVHSKT